MHAKSGHPAPPKQNQHPVIQILKKFGHFPQDTNAHRNVKSTYNAVPFSKNAFPKNATSVPYQKGPYATRNFLNVSTITKSGNTNKPEAHVIFKRCNHNNSWSSNINRSVIMQKNAITNIAQKEAHTNIMHKNMPKNVQSTNVNKQLHLPQQKDPVVEPPKILCEHAPSKNIVQQQNITFNRVQQQNNVNRVQQQNTVNRIQQQNISVNQLQQQKSTVEKPNNQVTTSAVKKNQQSKKDEVKNETKPKSSQKKDVVELYSREETKKQNALDSSENKENLNFQKVTQELATIIKNFQKQIQDVPTSKSNVDLPPEILQPKDKEFFKNPQKPQSPTNSAPKKQPDPPPSPPTRVLKNVNKQSSLRSVVNSSNTCKTGDIRKFRSFTHHELPTKFSTYRGLSNRASNLGLDPLKQLKEEVQKAIREKKTFTVRGQFHPIRKALIERGWVEKYHISYKDQLNDDLKRYQNYTISELLPLTRREDLTKMCRNLIKSKLLSGIQVDFYWGINDDAFKENPDKIKLTLINKLKREIFSYTNKQGLCDASKSSYWYQKSNVSKLNHPRTYSLGKNGETQSFINDFHITAAMSLLKWVVKMNATKECKLISATGTIPIETFDFAVNECCKFIKRERHDDIDVQIPDAKEQEWNQFLDYFYKLVHYNNHFKLEGNESEDSLVQKSNYILDNLRALYPYVDMDGMMNIWILKPTASSRGRGIHMCRTVQYVLKVIKQNPNTRYIIQKYIERPLLIYNTKFDIRQWFLISNCCPLTIWMYKECYLRFSSQTYNLRKLHESIHLTNNSVQCKYKSNSLDSALPNYNMWDSTEFQRYLSNIGYPKAFKDIIYPGMKQCISAAVLMHHEKMVIRKNCFELYGADFMLTEDFQPWLLEINSSPALFASTPVTARMCPQVLEDLIKVVIDHAHNSKANTGQFEMIYKEQLTKLPATKSLELKGLPLQKNYFFTAPDDEFQEMLDQQTSSSKTLAVDQAQVCLKTFGEEIKKTLKNLLQIIHNEKQKRGIQNRPTENLGSVVC